MIRQIVMYQIMCSHGDCSATASPELGFLDHGLAEASAEGEGFQTIRTATLTETYPGTHYCPAHKRADLPNHNEMPPVAETKPIATEGIEELIGEDAYYLTTDEPCTVFDRHIMVNMGDGYVCGCGLERANSHA